MRKGWTIICLIAMIASLALGFACDTGKDGGATTTPTTEPEETSTPTQEPAAFQISHLEISPEETMVGQPVEISVTVTNTGDLAGTYTGNLMIDGVAESSQDITVAGGSEGVLSFTVTKNTAKIYNATIGTLTAPFVVMSDHLVLTLSFDDDPDGYPQGAQVNVYILDGHRFRLTDRYGTFNGDYSWDLDDNELTLDFDSYPPWRMTMSADGTFSGREAGYDDGGTYDWQ